MTAREQNICDYSSIKAAFKRLIPYYITKDALELLSKGGFDRIYITGGKNHTLSIILSRIQFDIQNRFKFFHKCPTQQDRAKLNELSYSVAYKVLNIEKYIELHDPYTLTSLLDIINKHKFIVVELDPRTILYPQVQINNYPYLIATELPNDPKHVAWTLLYQALSDYDFYILQRSTMENRLRLTVNGFLDYLKINNKYKSYFAGNSLFKYEMPENARIRMISPFSFVLTDARVDENWEKDINAYDERDALTIYNQACLKVDNWIHLVCLNPQHEENNIVNFNYAGIKNWKDINVNYAEVAEAREHIVNSIKNSPRTDDFLNLRRELLK